MEGMIRDAFRYLPISPRTRSWGLFVTGGGHIEVPPDGTHPPEGHPNLYEFTWDRGRVLPEYQVILITDGSGMFESDGTELRELRGGDVVVLFPGVWHRYRPNPETGWSSYWVGLGGEFMENTVQRGFLSPERSVVVPLDLDGLTDAFQRFHGSITGDTIENPLMLSAVAMEILSLICAPVGNDAAEPSTAPFQEAVHDRIVAEALRIIWSRDDSSLNVADVAGLLPVSRRSLERRFQQVLGRTVLGEITRCRVERVKGLLEETDLPLKQLAKLVGFSSPETLAKAFQRHVGETPSAYRKERQQ
jgi:AraC-like DNA-binding protein